MKAIFTIPEDTDMLTIPVNDQTRPPEDMVALIRAHLAQRSMVVSQTTNRQESP